MKPLSLLHSERPKLHTGQINLNFWRYSRKGVSLFLLVPFDWGNFSLLSQGHACKGYIQEMIQEIFEGSFENFSYKLLLTTDVVACWNCLTCVPSIMVSTLKGKNSLSEEQTLFFSF